MSTASVCYAAMSKHLKNHDCGLKHPSMTATSECHPSLPAHLVRTLELLRGGMTQREMAAELGVSFNTVHKYVQEIYQHFGVRGRVQLLSWMLEPAAAAAKSRVSVTLPRHPKRTGRGTRQSGPPHLMK